MHHGLESALRRGAVAIIFATLPFIASAQQASQAPVATDSAEYAMVAIETPERRAARERVNALELAALKGPREIGIGKGVATLRLAEGEGFVGPDDAAWIVKEVWRPSFQGPVAGIVVAPSGQLSDSAGGHFIVQFVDDPPFDPEALYDPDSMLFGLQARAEEKAIALPEGRRPLNLQITWAVAPYYDSKQQTSYTAVRIGADNRPTQMPATVTRGGRNSRIVMSTWLSENSVGGFAETAKSLLSRTKYNPGHRVEDFKPVKSNKVNLSAIPLRLILVCIGALVLPFLALLFIWIGKKRNGGKAHQA